MALIRFKEAWGRAMQQPHTCAWLVAHIRAAPAGQQVTSLMGIGQLWRAMSGAEQRSPYMAWVTALLLVGARWRSSPPTGYSDIVTAKCAEQ